MSINVPGMARITIDVNSYGFIMVGSMSAPRGRSSEGFDFEIGSRFKYGYAEKPSDDVLAITAARVETEYTPVANASVEAFEAEDATRGKELLVEAREILANIGRDLQKELNE